MPYLFLIIGLIIGALALTRFFVKASPAQIKQAAFIAAVILFVFVLLFFALTGRIVIALVLLVPAALMIARYYRRKK